jgi:hypothetical protein
MDNYDIMAGVVVKDDAHAHRGEIGVVETVILSDKRGGKPEFLDYFDAVTCDIFQESELVWLAPQPQPREGKEMEMSENTNEVVATSRSLVAEYEAARAAYLANPTPENDDAYTDAARRVDDYQHAHGIGAYADYDYNVSVP